ncbi:hypothetical protein [Streptomyces violaceorubidus]|uniref:hypothetical protein n=1 Tax=Streptomyces violaceorubidus TaxID=284042 RepID=UPI001FD74997|nr:hypothetical protein [Streptomyces violaceorubidus]
MPGLDGLATTELLRRRPQPPQVLILTTFTTTRTFCVACVRAPSATSSSTPLRHRSSPRWRTRHSRPRPTRTVNASRP